MPSPSLLSFAPRTPPAPVGRGVGMLAHWRCDLGDDTLTWSDGVYDLFGLPRGSTLDRRAVVDQYLGASRTLLADLRAHAIATGTGFAMDAQIERPDGGRRWFRLAAEVLRDGDRSLALIGVKRDITDLVPGHRHF